MSSSRLAKLSRSAAIIMVVVSVAGFITTLVLNAFFLDRYDAYGEVPIPGSGNVQLPAGEVTASLHALVIGGSSGGGLPVPPLGVTIIPPDGVAQPVVSESFGSTATVNNDAHVRVWVIRIAKAGTYHVTTDGQVSGYITPRLAFGHQSAYGFLVWVFVGLFAVGLVDVVLSSVWLGRTRRSAAAAVVAARPEFPVVSAPPPEWPPTTVQEPSGEGVRLERLKTLAALRDSGALTEEEFQSEKRRIVDEG